MLSVEWIMRFFLFQWPFLIYLFAAAAVDWNKTNGDLLCAQYLNKLLHHLLKCKRTTTTTKKRVAGSLCKIRKDVRSFVHSWTMWMMIMAFVVWWYGTSWHKISSRTARDEHQNHCVIDCRLVLLYMGNDYDYCAWCAVLRCCCCWYSSASVGPWMYACMVVNGHQQQQPQQQPREAAWTMAGHLFHSRVKRVLILNRCCCYLPYFSCTWQ